MPTTPRLALPYPDADDTVDVPRDVQALADALDGTASVPVGALFMWPTATPPASFLLCNGAKVLASTYPLLAAVLGSSGGQITLPDLRDRFPVGAGSTMALGSTGGASSVTLAEANLPAHDHPGSGLSVPSRMNSNGNGGSGPLMQGDGSGSLTSVAVAGDTGNAGSGVPVENRPPYRGVNFIIRAA